MNELQLNEVDAREFLRKAGELVTTIETTYLELGARLFTIRETGIWKVQYDSYEDYLEDIKVRPSKATMVTTVHEHYKLKGGFKDETLAKIGYSKLYASVPLIESDGIDLALSKALTLRRKDIEDEVRVLKHGEHTHQLGTDRFGVCNTCGKWIKITNEEKDLLRQ